MSPFGLRGLVQVKVANLDDTNVASNALGGEDRLLLRSFGFSATGNELTISVLIFVVVVVLGKASVYEAKT